MPRPTPNKGIEKRILKVVENSPIGLYITEVAELAEVNRITARKHLERLKDEGVLVEHKKGWARIFSTKRSIDIAAGATRQDPADCSQCSAPTRPAGVCTNGE